MSETKKRRSITNRLVAAFIIAAQITLLLAYAGFFAIAVNLRDGVTNVYTDISEKNTEVMEEGMLSQANSALKAIVTVQTEATDQRLSAISAAVKEAADYVETLYQSGSAGTGTVLAADEAPEGALCARYVLSKGVELGDVEEELKILSGAEEVFVPLLAYSDSLAQIYVGTESGIFYAYSSDVTADSEFVVSERPWYVKAVENQDEVIWIETYIDYDGKACISAAKAIHGKAGALVGVVGCDIRFDDMMNHVLADGLGETGVSMLLGENLDLIAYADLYDEDFDKSFEAHFEDAESVKAQLTDEDADAFFAVLDGREIYVTSKEVPETGWLFVSAVNKDEVYEALVTAQAESENILTDSSVRMKTMFKKVLLNMLVSFFVISAVVAVVGLVAGRKITKPIKQLIQKVKGIGHGDFDEKITLRSNDELEDLADHFNTMQDDLKAYTENLTQVTAEKERISSELSVATQIQADMLPRIFPPFPDKSEVDIYAMMEPAKEVGGDFYDFFLIDDNHLAFVVADVSGKGVPAALFMVISKTLIKNRAIQGGTPAEILMDVNNQLCEGNDAEMFVTSWLGILDLSTGLLTASNAGHEYPAIRDGSGHFTLLKDRHGLVMAGMENVRYTNYEVQLDKNGGFFVYTDGVPEAMNADKELFGTDRMLDALSVHEGSSPMTFLGDVRGAVSVFSGEADQFDDITMVGLVWHGAGQEIKKLMMEADISRLGELESFLETELEKRNCSMKTLNAIEVASEEIFTNIAHYAYPELNAKGKFGQVVVSLRFDAEDNEASIRFVDGGVRFNPLQQAEPDTTASAEDRKIGGLGIYMVKKTMDEVEYQYIDKKNVLTIKKKLGS